MSWVNRIRLGDKLRVTRTDRTESMADKGMILEVIQIFEGTDVYHFGLTDNLGGSYTPHITQLEPLKTNHFYEEARLP